MKGAAFYLLLPFIVLFLQIPISAYSEKLDEAAVIVTNVKELEAAVRQAKPNAVILIRDGVYPLDGRMLVLATQGVTVRSASGDRSAVVLDGVGKSPSVFEISASDVTISDLTIRSPYNHAIHVYTPRSGGDIRNIHLKNIHIVDPGQQGIKINPTVYGASLINGVIEQSLIELTKPGRKLIRNNCYTGGIDAHHSAGWVVRNNEIRGFWCSTGLSEHAIHFWRGSRNTLVERNVLMDNARGIGFGMEPYSGKTENEGCPSESDHTGGLIRDNLITTADSTLFDSQFGADCGICLWYACGAKAKGNRIFSARPLRTFSSIEWRFSATRAEIIKNTTNVRMLARDGASAITLDNRTDAAPPPFKDQKRGHSQAVTPTNDVY